MRFGHFPAVMLLPLLAACATGPIEPAADKLQQWTTSLRDRQPDDAFAAAYKVGRQRLVFVAAKHANRSDSLTFRLIRDAFAAFQFDSVIAEGFATSRGPNPERVIKYAQDSKPTAEGFVEAGELAPAVLGALAEGATVWGGEPGDLDVKSRVLAAGLSDADLLGFYVLRNVPQWIAERKIDNAGDPRLDALAAEALARNRAALQIPPAVLPDVGAWRAWYQALNQRPLAPGFDTEEVGPLADGRFGTNRVAYAVSRARDDYLHRLVIDHLNAGKSVLVVFGASHLMIQRPALDAALGRPCYVGSDLALAAAKCR